MSRIWDRFLTDRDRRVFAQGDYGRLAGFGARPVLLVIDVTYSFCGEERLPIEESVARWPNSCGESAWQALGPIQQLIAAARHSSIPVFYTTGLRVGSTDFDRGRWTDKNPRNAENRRNPQGNRIVEQVAPLPHEIVVKKGKPSAFFGTELISYLVDLGSDSLLICGGTTSGCVRSTVIDAFSYNFKVSVVEEAVFDRGECSHAISLFDLHQKYADVVSLTDALGYLATLPPGLFVSPVIPAV